MTSRDYFGVSLRIRHGARPPAELSTVLQRQPDHIGIKGTPRGLNIRGVVSLWTEHYWSAAFHEGNTPEARIAAVVQFLIDKEDVVVSILQSGGQADVYVFIAQDTVALEIGPSLLIVLGRIGVTLGVEVRRP